MYIQPVDHKLYNNSDKYQTLYSISSLTSSSALIKPYTRIVDDFNRLYSRRAYMQYFNGIEQDEFNECLEDLYTLIKDYEVTTWDYNNFDIGEEEEEEEEEGDEWSECNTFSQIIKYILWQIN